MKKTRQYHSTEYKRRIVAEYLSGTISAEDLAKREGLVRGQIYKWRVQLEWTGPKSATQRKVPIKWPRLGCLCF